MESRRTLRINLSNFLLKMTSNPASGREWVSDPSYVSVKRRLDMYAPSLSFKMKTLSKPILGNTAESFRAYLVLFNFPHPNSSATSWYFIHKWHQIYFFNYAIYVLCMHQFLIVSMHNNSLINLHTMRHNRSQLQKIEMKKGPTVLAAAKYVRYFW